MHSIKNIKEKIYQNSNQSHDIVFYFGTKFSIYFSWVFINLGFSPNFITGLFFLVGLIGAIIILYAKSISTIFLAYCFWRLHMIIDLCDGEVARYTQKFSINGSYWDFVIHAVLYPLYFINICILQFYRFNDIIFLFIGLFGSLIISLMFAVKNNYFRAMFSNSYSFSDYNEKSKNKNIKSFKNRLYVYLSDLFGFEGFLLLLVIFYNFSNLYISNQNFIKLLLLIYVVLFFLITLSKFVLLSIKGYYPKKR